MAPFEGVLDAALGHAQAIVDRLVETTRRPAAEYNYGWKTARDMVQLAGSGATLWLLYKHKRLAIPVSIATSAITAGLSSVSARFDPVPEPAEDDARTEQERLRDKIVGVFTDTLPNVAGLLPLLFAPSERAILTEPLDLAPRNPSIPFTPFEHVRNAAALYAAYSMVGHWLEMLFCQLIRLGVMGGEYDRSNTMLWDWWLHPFPAEGIAGLLIAGALSPLHDVLLRRFNGRIAPALALSFLANQVACTSIDYLMGITANRDYELWDYRDMPFNFQGQICLQNSLAYSAAATLVTWLAYPARDRWLRTLPTDITNLGFSALAPIYAFLHLTYLV